MYVNISKFFIPIYSILNRDFLGPRKEYVPNITMLVWYLRPIGIINFWSNFSSFGRYKQMHKTNIYWTTVVLHIIFINTKFKIVVKIALVFLKFGFYRLKKKYFLRISMELLIAKCEPKYGVFRPIFTSFIDRYPYR